jgi:hypothetical protein
MEKKTPFYKKTIVWENVKKTLAIVSGPTVYSLHELQVDDMYMLIAGAVTMFSAILAIWVCDNDKDGVVDLFE